jgi:superfamily I DNA and RNA helicase
VVDYRAPGIFDSIAQRFSMLRVNETEKVDELIIDEGQDFEQPWVEPLFTRVRPGGRIWWLEDPMQNLYDRPPILLPGWTVLRALTNFRNPRGIVEYVQKLGQPSVAPTAASPFAGGVDDLLVYSDTKGLVDTTSRAITLALRAGFKRDEIAVVTFAGRERSALRNLDRIGPHSFRKTTGRYDLLGTPEYQPGEILIETVYRFKGQSAPCVIFTEIDFDQWEEKIARKLFVGMTRASMRLFPVLSERAATQLMKRLD